MINYLGNFGIIVLFVGVLIVFINANKASISSLFNSNLFKIGDVVGIRESLGVPKYFFELAQGFLNYNILQHLKAMENVHGASKVLCWQLLGL